MLYIISGDKTEAEIFAKQTFQKKWMFIPDSEFSMVFRNGIDYNIVFIGSFKKRRDIISRLMESRDRLISDLSESKKHIVYKNNGEILSQNEFNIITEELKNASFRSTEGN